MKLGHEETIDDTFQDFFDVGDEFSEPLPPADRSLSGYPVDDKGRGSRSVPPSNDRVPPCKAICPSPHRTVPLM